MTPTNAPPVAFLASWRFSLPLFGFIAVAAPGCGAAGATSGSATDDGGSGGQSVQGSGGAGGAGGSFADGGGGAGVPAVTTVRVHYDTGINSSISLRGDDAGLSWDVGSPCTWSTGNVWICELTGGSAAIELKPLVDDTLWAKGTNYRTTVGGTIDIYPYFFSTGGRLETHADFGVQNLPDRDVIVYLPPSYDENLDKTYPMIVMQDGQNVFDPATSFAGVAWEVDDAMDALAEGAGIHEAIIVAGYSADRLYEYTPTEDSGYPGSGGDADYLDFVADELAPFIVATYRTEGTRVGIAGSSLGGLVSLHGCWTRPDVFDRCGVLSPSLWWDNQYMQGFIANDAATVLDKPLRIYIDSGDTGPSSDGMANVIEMRDLLVTKGFVLGSNLDYTLGVGHAHDETAWAARTPGALAFLLRDPDRVP